MSFINDCNEISRQLKQKRIRKNSYVGGRVQIEVPDGVSLLTTEEAAIVLNRSAQTLRLWACRGIGPITPVRIHGRLGWRKDQIEALVNGDGT